MPTNANVNKPSAAAKTIVLSPQDQTRAEGGTTAAIIGLLIAVGLVLFAVGGIYLNYLVGLPLFGQFIGS
jgi:riboflavin transporter FmnP